MTIEDPSDARAPFAADPEGLWATPLRREQRVAVDRAFERDRELRPEVESLLRGLGSELRSAFVVAFARGLVGPPAPARPAGALMPALEQTIGVAIDRPRQHTVPTRGRRDI